MSADPIFEAYWAKEIANNGGVSIGADYRHWAYRGWREALAAVPVEPVAWMMPWTGHSPSLTTDPSDYPQERDAGLLIPLYAHPAPQPQQALQTRLDDYATEINRLRNVIQAACIGGTDYMIERWKNLFPDAPVPTVKPQQAGRDCPHCNYSGTAHCGDVAAQIKANGGEPGNCSNAHAYGLRSTPAQGACQHKRYTVDVREQTGNCIDCGAEGAMRFVVPQPQQAENTRVTPEQLTALKRGLHTGKIVPPAATPPQPTAPAPQPEPLHLGACITDGKLHATVMRREANGYITVVAAAEIDEVSLRAGDCHALMTAPDPQAQAVSQTVAWAIPGTGQFSFERQDERFWTPLVAAQKEPT